MNLTIRMVMMTLMFFATARSSLADVTITPDVVYGHKYGLAMTFDIFKPTTKPNGAAVLFMVSGGWYSNWSPPEQAVKRFRPLTDEGFTVFAVRHGSSPKFSIPEAIADVQRSVRFIRMNADKFEIDPNRLGVFGMSAGGHLSLMLGTASDNGNAAAADPVDRVSNRVNAVVAYVAPTDLKIMVRSAKTRLPAYDRFPALDLDMSGAESASPLAHVTPDDAPTLLLAGAKDDLVPIMHSQKIKAAFELANVTNELIEFENAGHGFAGEDEAKATAAMVSWFKTHLATP
jgi:acetyl esterase/lipase